MITCRQAHELMKQALDAATDSAEEETLDEHLADCTRCAAEFADLACLDDKALSDALPLQVTLGEDFAARVTAQLPARRSSSRTLKEAFLMSRLKYAFAGILIIALAIYLLFPPLGFDAKALAAAQEAMSKVKSVHYVVDVTAPQHAGFEAWSSATATKLEYRGSWVIVKDGVSFGYVPSAKTLFVGRLGPLDRLSSVVDPKYITRLTYLRNSKITMKTVRWHNKRMTRVEVVSGWKIPDQAVDTGRKMAEAITQYVPSWKSLTTLDSKVARVTRSKAVFIIDPSSNLVRNVECFAPKGKGWRSVARTTLVEYNLDLPASLFNVPKMPAGTKTVDLRKLL